MLFALRFLDEKARGYSVVKLAQVDNVTINNARWVPVLLVVYNIAANLSNDIYLPSMAALVNVFNTTAQAIQLSMTAWLLGVAVPQFFLGFLVAKWGERRVLLAGGVVF